MKVRINIMNSKDILIKVNELYKIFGDGDGFASWPGYSIEHLCPLKMHIIYPKNVCRLFERN